MYYADRLAEWATSLKFADIPTEVVELAKLCIQDWTGITMYGSIAPWSKILLDLAKAEGGEKEASIVVDGAKVPATNAAMVNAVMALSYDLSDTFLATALHPGCCVIGAALAMGEREKTSGKDLITAVVAGYETTARIGLALNKPPQRSISGRGFEANGLIPSFGAAVAAGKLLDLNKDQMTNAIGLCSSSMGGGLIEYLVDGNWTYRWNAGKTASDGIRHALMAKKGFVGPHAVFEGHWDDKGRYGAINAFAGDMTHASEMINDLGERWAVKDIGFKYYGCCHYIHGFNDGMLKLMREKQIQPADIAEITCFVPHMTLFLAVPREAKIRPANLTVSQWSLPFCLAATIIDGHLLHPADQLSEKRLSDPQALELAQRIQAVRSRELDEIIREENVLQSPLKVKLKDGREYETTTSCKGFADNPLSDEEAGSKFKTLTSKVLSEEKVATLTTMLNSLEEINDVSQLARAMCVRQ